MIGGNAQSTPAWQQVYRSPEHGFAKNACSNAKAMQSFSQEVQDFANMFVQMQERRHRADYDPRAKAFKSAVLADIAAAKAAIADFENADIKERRAFAAAVLFKAR